MKKQLNLGELIFLLSRIAPESEVRYDFARFTPEGLDSYRGYYDQLALGYGEKEITVAELLKICKDMVGATRQGYKGGDFQMGESTPVWMAQWGDCYDTAIVGVIDTGYQAILETAYVG